MRILLVDDHTLFRAGLKLMLRKLDAELQLEETSHCAQAIERAAQQAYDLLLVDLKLPDASGMDAVRALREAVPAARLVVLSGEEDPHLVRDAIERGAMGFIPKSSTPEVLFKALDLVLAGGVYLPPAVLDSRVAAAPVAPEQQVGGDAGRLGLTPRQSDVLRCVIQGKPNKVIARELDISEGTVKAHLSSVMHALGAHNRTEAVYAAAKLGLKLA